MRLVPAAEWGARAPQGPAPVRAPVAEVYVHHPVTRPTADPFADFRTVDRISLARFGRRTYSYLVHPTGVVAEYAGRIIGAHTKGHNSTSVAVSFVGDFTRDVPTSAAVAAGRWLLEHLAATGVTVAAPRVRPHLDVYPTACPGPNLLPIIPQLIAPEDPLPMAAADAILAELAELRRDVARIDARTAQTERQVTGLTLDNTARHRALRNTVSAGFAQLLEGIAPAAGLSDAEVAALVDQLVTRLDVEVDEAAVAGIILDRLDELAAVLPGDVVDELRRALGGAA